MRHLQLLVALADRGTLRGAAEELCMTQPAASKSLHELEQLLGVQLFERHSRGVEVTAYGEAVTHYARFVFEDLDSVREELAAIEAGEVGRVRIGAVMAPMPGLLTRSIIALKQQHPRLHIAVQLETSDVLVQTLQQGQIDMFIGRIPDGWPAQDLSFEPLSDEALSIVARPGHPACASDSLKSLARYSWILQPHPSPMRQIIDRTFISSRVPLPDNALETSSILTTISLLLESDMLAVLPTSVASFYRDQGMISILPVELDGRLAPYGLILRKDRRTTRATQLVIDTMLEASKGSNPLETAGESSP